MNTVQSVEIKKQGEGAKGPWTMYGIVLEDGRKASGFELVRVGETVELEQKGKYLNYKKLNGAHKAHTPPQESTVRFPMNKDDYWARKEERDVAREQRDIDKQPRIERQHAQEMALRFFSLFGKRDKVISTTELRQMIDFFQRDISVEPKPVQHKAGAGTLEEQDNDEPPF